MLGKYPKFCLVQNLLIFLQMITCNNVGVIFYFSGNCVGFSWLAVMAELELKNDLPEAKKPLISPKIGTHNGTFHCDEALACFMLKQLPEYRHADIVRTRNPEELAKCDVVVDVGGVYDPEKHRYDHHQRCVN